MTNEIKIPQTEEEINESWNLLLKHLEACEDWGDGYPKIDRNIFVEYGKQEFLIITIHKKA